MIFPDIINYLLTLRYPGSETGRQNWVCYHGVLQVIVPIIASGQTINYTARPLAGVHAWIGYSTKFGSDVPPNVLTGTVQQYGAIPYSGVITQALRDNEIEGFLLITEQEPEYLSVTNISPLAQRGECIGSYLVVPSPQDMETIFDALRRLHTSKESEELLQRIASRLDEISGQPQTLTPKPPLGGH